MDACAKIRLQIREDRDRVSTEDVIIALPVVQRHERYNQDRIGNWPSSQA